MGKVVTKRHSSAERELGVWLETTAKDRRGRDLRVGMNLTRKILSEHLVVGKLEAGCEIGLRIDQVLTQDSAGPMAYLQFEAMGMDRIAAKLSVTYADHNLLQEDFKNADDHLYLQTAAARYGSHYSRPGNGICHQVHRERFGVPGQTLLGSDSHTPTCGALGMIAIGAGGLDVAVAMGGGPFHFVMPRVVGVRAMGRLQPWVTGKDVVLELLRRMTVRGGVGKIVEYFGPGLASLSMRDRFTIANMGTELGCTASVFPSDEETREFLTRHGRGSEWAQIEADAEADYDEGVEIDLDSIEPLIAQPHSPDNITSVRALAGTRVQQVCIGSCTNSSFDDLARAALMLRGRSVHQSVSMSVTPGSRRVLQDISLRGYLTDLIGAGCRILESACGPCAGMGLAPATKGVSVRSFNRNFEGRSGTQDALVYLASPETCVATALRGEITDPRDLGIPLMAIDEVGEVPDKDNMIIPPPVDGSSVEVIRGPNIRPLPRRGRLEPRLQGGVLLKVGDNITTDHILPLGVRILPLRSNVPAISEFTFYNVDKDFPNRAREKGGGFVVGGLNYGQGSSREHAALAPMYLGIKAVLVKSVARIHRANLINFGILPLVFDSATDYENVNQGDVLLLEDIREQISQRATVQVRNLTRTQTILVSLDLSEREKQIVLAGGLLNLTGSRNA